MSDVSAFQPPVDETVERIVRSVWLPMASTAEAIRRHFPNIDGDATVRRLLNTALSSGEVRARLHGETGYRPLKPTANFSLHVPDGTVLLEDIPGEVFDCAIHSDDLERFLIGRKIPSTPVKANKVYEATMWLVARINAGEMQSNEKMAEKVKSLFGVGLRQYRQARKKAIEMTGRTKLSEPGRRPSAQIET